MTASKLRSRLRAEIAAHPALWRFYKLLRRRIMGECPYPGPVHQLLDTFAKESHDVRFIQVGSNDAAFGDPIIDFVQEYGWHGVLVEPVPYVFQKLRQRFERNPRLALENTAIGEYEGPRRFYYLEQLESPLSAWYSQLGSFSRHHIEKHERYTPGISQHICEIEVPCQSLNTLLEKHKISSVDLLQIDAEGSDFEVIRSLDFKSCTPAIVLFEIGHLPRAERQACSEYLEAHGYRLMYEGRDCLALNETARSRWPMTTLTFDALSPEP